MIKNTLIGHQYFIDISNIHNKLFDALAGIKIDLTLTSITSNNSDLTFVSCIFLSKK
jgi:hypothetical protein